MDILGGLNEEQREAVLHDQGPLLVVAGAGTGKTQVITRRIAQLISQQKASPGQILSLTFTEKAAREMEERLYGLIGWQSFQVPVMTFNAFGAELLGRYSLHLGRSIRGGLLTDSQKALLLKQHYDQVQLKYYGAQSDLYEFMERIVAYIGKLQNAAITPVGYRDYLDRLVKDPGVAHPGDIAEQKDLASLYELYVQIKEDTGTYDYFDQLALPLQILQERPNIAQRLGKEYRYVLVDEYQDTSPIQDALLRSFIPKDGNIFAVGDDDQAIYSFRGADIDNILSFTSHFEVKRPTTLIKNYRSGQSILDAAYGLIQHNNPDRLEQRLALDKRLKGLDTPATVAFHSYENPTMEYVGVADFIEGQIQGGKDAASIGVLARSRAPLRGLAKVLLSRGLPFALAADVDIFSEREVINLWYLLEWVGETADNESIIHVLMGHFFGWTSGQCRDVTARSKRDLERLEEVLRGFANEGNKDAAEAVTKLDQWRSWAAEMPVSQLTYRLIFDGGMAEALRQSGMREQRVLRVFEDLYRLLTQMQEYEEVATDNSLRGYLRDFPSPPKLASGDLIGEAAGVQLLTVHGAKGLEFDSVFLINCTQRAWTERNGGGLEPPPELVSKKSTLEVHEQRRLMYVAATRAKHELHVSAPAASLRGQTQPLSLLVEQLISGSKHAQYSVNKADKADELMQKLQRVYPLKSAAHDRTLPFEVSGGWLEIGVEALHQYDTCPYDFYLQYVLGIKEPFGTPMAFGSVMHRAIQLYYDAQLRGEAVGIDDLNALITEQWRHEGYESREQSDADLERARQTMAWFLRRESLIEKTIPPTRKILGSEVGVRFQIPEAKLWVRGRIDAYYMTPAGIEIRDFKTGRSQSDPEKISDKAKSNFQLRTYALGYQVLNDAAPAIVTLDYIMAQAEGSASLSSRILESHRGKLISIAERIRLREFAPAPNTEFHTCAATRFYGEAYDESDAVTTIGSIL